MAKRVVRHLRGNLVGYLALVFALGIGTAWALDRNSVRSKHIVNGQVKDKDLADPTYWAVVDGDGELGRRGQRKTSSERTTEGNYRVDFNRKIGRCAYVATTGKPTNESAAPGAIDVRSEATGEAVVVRTQDLAANDEDRGFHLAVHC